MKTLRTKHIIQNKCFSLEYDADKRLILGTWAENKQMTMEEFKAEMLIFKEVFKQYEVENVLWLQENFTSEITLEAHAWVEENVNKPCSLLGLKKLGFVVGKDVMAHLTIFNYFDDLKSCVEPKHFSGLQEALDWVGEKEELSKIKRNDISIEFLGKTENGKSQFVLEMSSENIHSTLKSFKNIIQENVFLRANAHKFYSLTHRELEVFKRYANGDNFKKIAETLFLSEFTVRTHWRNAKKKLEIKHHSDIAKYKNSFAR